MPMDTHNAWVADAFGVDPNNYGADATTSDASPAGDALTGTTDRQSDATQSAGSDPTGGDLQVNAPGSDAARDDGPPATPAGSAISADIAGGDAGSTAADASDESGEADAPSVFDKLAHAARDGLALGAGAFVHAAAAVIPGGAIAAAAIDSEIAAKADPETKFYYGAGTMMAAAADGAIAAGEITVGVVGAPETAGLSLAISAEGVNAAAAAGEAALAGTALMAAGSPSGGGGGGGGGGRRQDPNAGKTVTEILKGKKGSIKQAPLEPGSPSWDQIGQMKWEDIVAGARARKPGYDTIRKLLTDGRFNR
jgi:hypothetical protein